MALTGTTSMIRVEGLDKALTQLNEAVRKIRFRTKQGMIKAGLYIQRQSQKLTPIDTGNLKASAFTVWGGGGRASAHFSGKDAAAMSMDHATAVAEERAAMPGGLMGDLSPSVSVGYSAAYAVYVHEDLEASHVKTVKDKGKKGATMQMAVGEAKFLEKAVVNNLPEIIALITGEVK